MKNGPSVFALSLAILCVPGVAMAQSSNGTLTSTPGVTCTGSGATGDCTVDRPNQDPDASEAGAGTLGNTTPGSGGSTLGGGSSTGEAAGTLNNTTPGATGGSSADNSSGTSGTLNNTTPGATGDSSGETSNSGTTGAGSNNTILPPSGGSGGSGGAGGGLGGSSGGGSSGGGSSGGGGL